MRTKKHYETMMEKNLNSSIGLSLATQAVYAAKTGLFDRNADNFDDNYYRKTYLRLQNRYGENMSAQDVRSEMTIVAANSMIGSIKTPRKSETSRANGKKGGRPVDPRPYMYAVQRYNSDTGAWEYKLNSPMSLEEAEKELKTLRKWATDDESGERYRKTRVYLR